MKKTVVLLILACGWQTAANAQEWKGNVVRVGSHLSEEARQIHKITIGDGEYIRIGEWERDDCLSFFADKGYNFTGGNAAVSGTLSANSATISGTLSAATIKGNVEAGTLSATKATISGNVGIGVAVPQGKLDVNGTIYAKEVKIEERAGADFVFNNNYHLKPLSEVNHFIQENKHLPEIPSAAEMQSEGVGVGELQMKMLQKIEELTLYMIKQEEKIEALTAKIEELENNKQ